jgi:TolA-binding protein
MKQSPQVDLVLRWRDRPAGGASDHDRAVALARDVLAAGGLPDGLDDRQLLRIGQSLKTGRRARPSLSLRFALVATLLIVSVASVMGYETNWFAPVRERLRFRSIPPLAPEPPAHPKRQAPRAETTAAEDAPVEAPPPARTSVPAFDVAAADSARPRVAAPAPRRAPPPAVTEAALAGATPPAAAPLPTPADEHRPPTEASEEIQALERAVGLLRGKHDAPAALAALDDYVARFPGGVLAPEARVARIDALLMLGRADEALRALETLSLDAHRRSTELQLIRGELRGRTDCGRAEADFTAVLARVQTAVLEERALYGRAACRSREGNAKGAADDLRRYIERFPNGTHAGWARRWLENNHE